MDEVRESFRRVGLSHLLSISGAHLTILLLLVGGLTKVVIPQPRRIALVLGIVLVAYLLAVPLRVPITRAAIMVGCFLSIWLMGRRVHPLSPLALAAILVLLWRPGDLVDAGFQLSFGVVLGLLLFTRRVSHLIYPVPRLDAPVTAGQRAGRFAADAVAVSLVAFAIALPIVAWHFQIVSPIAVVASLLALVPFSLLLGLGYAKILLGLVLPSASSLLAPLTLWAGDSLLSLVAFSDAWPASSFELVRQPSLVWVAVSLAVLAVVLSGRWVRGRALNAACLCLPLLWLSGEQAVMHRPSGATKRCESRCSRSATARASSSKAAGGLRCSTAARSSTPTCSPAPSSPCSSRKASAGSICCSFPMRTWTTSAGCWTWRIACRLIGWSCRRRCWRRRGPSQRGRQRFW